ncbi:hypothetical protein [Mucispirillum schaedleri]|uniref:hypothetical protein n=1 Tax=Mucispirillum schaedleri TaxID=248039 RepID=UPI001F5AAA69|nr:hypothetical protein [Mucispirillum schaedleri]
MTPVEFMLYRDISENISVNVVVKDETIWHTKLFRKGNFSPFYLSPECKKYFVHHKIFS